MNETLSKANPNTKRYHIMKNCLEVEQQYLQHLQELNEVLLKYDSFTILKMMNDT